MNTTTTTVPAGLSTTAEGLWRAITSGYDLRCDELVILEDACREADLVDRMEAELAGAALLVKGSMGQPVASPLAQEVRQHRAVLARLLGQLRLPDDDGRAAQSRSAHARTAAMARWGKR